MKLATPHIVYYGESHMKYPEYYAESKLPVLFSTGSHHYLRGVYRKIKNIAWRGRPLGCLRIYS